MIEVQHAGIYTSVQDLGRAGNRRFGVPVSGVMDREMAIAANEVLGNPPDAALLEFTNPGPTLFFTKPAIVAISGSPVEVTLNDEKIDTHKPVLIETNSVMKIGRAEEGVWTYLAVKGGILSKEVLNSRSFYEGITDSSRLAKGDILEISALSELSSQEVNWGDKLPDFEVSEEVEVAPGPEYSNLSELQKLSLAEQKFDISAQSNRMASLVNAGSGVKCHEITTAPVQPGTVQITPSGKMIVLMRDAQTTGGYARIFQLTDNGFTQLVRIKPGGSFRFRYLG